MIEQLANHIVDYDPMAVLRCTQDTVRYIQAEWSRNHTESIDEDAVRLFLCDEHCGNLSEEQKAFARRCCDEVRNERVFAPSGGNEGYEASDDEKREKALTLLGVRASHNIPRCGLFSGLPRDAL